MAIQLTVFVALRRLNFTITRRRCSEDFRPRSETGSWCAAELPQQGQRCPRNGKRVMAALSMPLRDMRGKASPPGRLAAREPGDRPDA